MSNLVIWSGIFLVSLFVLVKASDYFVRAAETIGVMLGISQYVVGVLFVALGTSLPELISSFFAVFDNASEIVAGNVVGSNITNIFLIVGIAAIIGKNITIEFDVLYVDLPLLLGSAFFLALTVEDSFFSRGEALLSVGGFAVLLIYTLQGSTQNTRQGSTAKSLHVRYRFKPFLLLLVSSVAIFFGAKYTIDAVIHIGKILQVGNEVIAVSAVALGTSLPELTVGVSAIRQGKAEIVIGNILGSNIFNTFAVMGLPGLIRGLDVSASLVSSGVPLMVIATILFFAVIQDRRLTRWEGWLFLLFYVYFLGKIFHVV